MWEPFALCDPNDSEGGGEEAQEDVVLLCTDQEHVSKHFQIHT